MKRLTQLFIALIISSTNIIAQNVNTTYFLDNAPMRHTINPAFQPVSEFYLPLPAIGNLNAYLGNNAFTTKNINFNDGFGFVLEDDAYKKLPNFVNLGTDVQFNLISFGWAVEDYGYVHINSTERIEAGGFFPKQLFGSKQNTGLELDPITATAAMFADLAIGYSHRFNDKWTIGAKAKLLLGHGYVSGTLDGLDMQQDDQSIQLNYQGKAVMAGLIHTSLLNGEVEKEQFTSQMWRYLIPSGYGSAFDIGLTYKPINQIQLSAAVVDLGFMKWKDAEYANIAMDTTISSISNYDNIISGINAFNRGLHINNVEKKAYRYMINPKLNIGFDVNLWKNRIGMGIYSQTRFYNSYVSEELTIGAAFKPFNWFNIAASYSFINGNWSNMGAAISLAPYDGIMLTFAADYLPFQYKNVNINNNIIKINNNANIVNLSIGIAVVTGTNSRKWKYKDDDKDGVFNIRDLCPNTPRGAIVDIDGCPIDFDADGVPDNLDKCPNTPIEAYAYIDSEGCPEDLDQDGVYDYLDRCLETPADLVHTVDSFGCPIDTTHQVTLATESADDMDSDKDGILDKDDACPTTYGVPENKGCPQLKQEIRNLLQKSLAGIQFEFDKADIRPESYSLLNKIADVFIQNKNYTIEIQGHTDTSGEYQYNMILSQKRAESVRNYLIEKGVSPDMLTAIGYGPDKPIADNSTKAGRKLNRRVEFQVTYEEVIIKYINDKVEGNQY